MSSEEITSIISPLVPAPTIEQFYKYCAQRKLMGSKCKNCGAIFLPPRIMCNKCYSTNLEWVELKGEGEIVTYTVIHVPPTLLKGQEPYVFAVVRLDEGVQIGGLVKDVKMEDLKIGLRVKVDFEEEAPPGVWPERQWPKWVRFYFKPA